MSERDHDPAAVPGSEQADAPGPEPTDGRVRPGRLPWGRLTAEFLVIVVGVLVALGVDQLAESRQNEALAIEVLQALGSELEMNRDQLARRIEYHESLLPGLDSLQRLAERGERTNILRSDALPDGIGFWLLSDTAWELAVVTEAIRFLDVGLASFLSTTYAVQESLRESERRVSDGIIRPEWFGADDQGGAVIFLSVMMRDLLSLERELERFCDESIAEIRERLGDRYVGRVMEVS